MSKGDQGGVPNNSPSIYSTFYTPQAYGVNGPQPTPVEAVQPPAQQPVPAPAPAAEAAPAAPAYKDIAAAIKAGAITPMRLNYAKERDKLSEAQILQQLNAGFKENKIGPGNIGINGPGVAAPAQQNAAVKSPAFYDFPAIPTQPMPFMGGQPTGFGASQYGLLGPVGNYDQMRNALAARYISGLLGGV